MSSNVMLIPLHKRDGAVSAYAQVSTEDYDYLAMLRWSVSGSGYARRCVVRNGKQVADLMHHLVLERMGLVRMAGMIADHIDRDRLNNTRDNLRWVDWPTSLRNRRPMGVSKYRGVFTGYHEWEAAIYVPADGSRTRRVYLGHFATAQMAAQAYDTYAVGNAVPVLLNFPELWERTWGNEQGPTPEMLPTPVSGDSPGFAMKYARALKGRKGRVSPKGDRHGRAKLTETDIEFILEHREITGKEMARRLNVTQSHVSKIRRGVRWSHLQHTHTVAVNSDEEPHS